MAQEISPITLTIAMVTMNRADQLTKALKSCLACDLPPKTEFVVIDNASTDHTPEVVRDTLDGCGYAYHYEHLPHNRGVGGGRNVAFSMAHGKYVYMLDDDAVIDVAQGRAFFTKCVEILEQNPRVMTLTTQIYDTAWEQNRVETVGKPCTKGVYEIPMFLGGSHFLRRDFFEHPPYLDNLYGYEELPPSLAVLDARGINGFCPSLRVIHQPWQDRRDLSVDANRQLLAEGFALMYEIKKALYPKLLTPVLWLAYRGRCERHLKGYKAWRKKGRTLAATTLASIPVAYKKIHYSTVAKMFVKFGKRIF